MIRLVVLLVLLSGLAVACGASDTQQGAARTTDAVPMAVTTAVSQSRATAVAYPCQSDMDADERPKGEAIYEPGGNGVRGCVTDINGAPIDRAFIDADPLSPLVGTSSIAYFTNEIGRYWYGGLQPGRYAITASAPGYKAVTKQVAVKEGHTAVLDFVLPREE